MPSPDYTAETHSESVNSDYYDVICDNCGETCDLMLSNGCYSGDGELEGVDDIYDIKEEITGVDDE